MAKCDCENVLKSKASLSYLKVKLFGKKQDHPGGLEHKPKKLKKKYLRRIAEIERMKAELKPMYDEHYIYAPPHMEKDGRGIHLYDFGDGRGRVPRPPSSMPPQLPKKNPSENEQVDLDVQHANTDTSIQHEMSDRSKTRFPKEANADYDYIFYNAQGKSDKLPPRVPPVITDNLPKYSKNMTSLSPPAPILPPKRLPSHARPLNNPIINPNVLPPPVQSSQQVFEDPFIGENVPGLDKFTFNEFLSQKDAVLIMFYDLYSDKSTVPKENFLLASKMTTRDNHAFAGVNCAVERRLCDHEKITTYPYFQLYSRGSYVNSLAIDALPDTMAAFVATAPVIDNPTRPSRRCTAANK